MSYQIVILILTLIVLLAAALVFGEEARNNLKLTRLFFDSKCLPTKKLGQLWIDENNRKWCCKTADRLFGYSEIIEVDIQADGVSLKKEAEYISLGCSTEMTAERRRTVEQIIVVVIVSDKDIGCVNIPVGKSPVQIGSIEYEHRLKLANSMYSALDKMKNEK